METDKQPREAVSPFTYTAATWPPAQRQPQKFDFIKWRSDRRAFFLRDERSVLVVATPELPKLADDWQFPKPPFPKSAVVAVRPYRLIPPPVKADPSAPPAARWEVLYGREHHLCPTPEDQPALQKLLDQENAARRQSYRDRVDPKNLSQEWERLKGGERAQAKRQPGFKQFCQQRRQLLDERGLNRDLTMADLLRNPEGMLGDYLRQWWAEQEGIVLDDIGYLDPTKPHKGWMPEPAEFLAWMRAHCPALSRPAPTVRSDEAETSLQQALTDSQGRSFPEVFTEIELLATVRYVAEFENGPRVFLAGLELVTPGPDGVGEPREFGTLTGGYASPPHIQPPARIEWLHEGLRGVRYSQHTSGADWRTILWTGNQTFGSKLLPKLMESKERELSRADVVNAGGFKGSRKGDDSGQTVERFHGSATIRKLLKAGIIDWPSPEAPLRLATDGPR